MNDVIYRQDAIDAVDVKCLHRGIVKGIQGIIEDLPSAQPQRKKGKWITVKGRLGDEVECDKCGSVFWYWMGNYRFCPSCGARMGE